MENSVEVLLGFHNRCRCRFYPLPVGQNTTLVHLGFSQLWRLGSPRSRHWQIGCVVIAHFLVHSRVILLCPHIREGWKSFAAFFLIRALSSSIRTLLSWPNCLAVHTVRWTQGGQAKRLEGDSRSCRNCRHAYSLLADTAAAVAADTLYSPLSWLTQWTQLWRSSKAATS